MMQLFYRSALWLSLHRQNLSPSSFQYKFSMKASGAVIKTASFLLPIIYKWRNNRFLSRQPSAESDAPVISLTSYPARIPYVWITVSSLLRQSVTPHKIILWLSKEQFPNEFSDLPENLKALQCDLFSIRFVEDDIRSHKKYFYAFSEFPDRSVIVTDDDVIYPYDTVKELMNLHDRYKKDVCCMIGHEITSDKSGYSNPYLSWNANPVGEKRGQSICPIGLGGVLYPAGCYADAVLNKNDFMTICPYADDLWLKLMCHQKGTVAVKPFYRIPGFSVNGSQETSLFSINGKNDRNTTQWRAIIQKYGILFKEEKTHE